MSESSPYVDIAESLKDGGIVPFIGAGVEADIYINFAVKLAEKVTDLLRRKGELKEEKKDEKKQEQELIRKLIGVPCSFCHYLESRPNEGCPMLEGIDCSLYKEQQLAVAKMHIRSFSEYLKFEKANDTFYEYCRDAFNNSNISGPHGLHNFLISELPELLKKKNLPKNSPGFPFQVIVTTNYDNKLEERFDEIKQDYDVVSYTINNVNDTKDEHFKLTRVTFERQGEGEEKLKSIEKTENNGKLESSYDKFQLRHRVGTTKDLRPVILKLYGSWNDPDQFAVTEDQINPLIEIVAEKLPVKLKRIIQKSHSLFLGYSLNDFDLDLIIKMFWEKPNQNLPGKIWLVNQADPSYLDTYSGFWKKHEKKAKDIFVCDSVENFIDNVKNQLNVT